VYYRSAEKSRPESRLDYFHRRGATSEKAICTKCGGELCAHGHCPNCESGVCDECGEEQFATDEDDQELGGES
jgi:hypothetical protein